jgi:class 3 adenylate cyclase
LLETSHIRSMNPVTLTFRDAELEARFAERRIEWITAKYGAFLVFVGVLTAVSLLIHWTGSGVARPPLGVMITEATFPLTFALAAVVYRTAFFRKWFKTCTFALLSLFVLTASAILVFGRPEQQAPAATLTVLVLLVNCFHPTTLSVRYAASAVAVIAHLAAAWVSGFMEKPQFATMLLLIFVAQAICAGVSYLLERMVRANFFLNERLAAEAAWSERLLASIFPARVLQRIAARGSVRDVAMVERHAEVSILFADLVGFTEFAATTTPEATVGMLNDVFSRFDALAAQHGVEKIKTMGDAYLAVAGLPDPDPEHAWRLAELALDMRDAVHRYNTLTGARLEIRIGMHTGEVVAGIIGTRKFHFDIWGDAVNTAARLEANGIPGGIVVSQELHRLLQGRFQFKDLGLLKLKGKGDVQAFTLEAFSPRATEDLTTPERPRSDDQGGKAAA